MVLTLARATLASASNPVGRPAARSARSDPPHMPNIGPVELIIILVIALIVIGPGRLPDVGAALGKSIREFRKASSDLTEAARVDVSPQAAPAPAAPPATPAPAAPAAPVVPPAVPAPAASETVQPTPNTLANETAPNTLASAPADPAPVAASSTGDDPAAPPA